MAVPSAVITSRTNSRVKQLRAACSKGPGYDGDLVAIEGEHLVHEAFRSGITPQTLFLTPAYPLPPDLARQTEVVRLAEDVFSSAVETRTPQGIAALIQRPSWELKEIVQKPAALLKGPLPSGSWRARPRSGGASPPGILSGPPRWRAAKAPPSPLKPTAR